MEGENLKDKLIAKALKFYESDRRWLLLKRIGIGTAFVISLLIGMSAYIGTMGRWPVLGGEYAAVVNIQGVIDTGSLASANRVIPALRKAFKDEDAKMVILQVDSPGGSPLEAERIYTEILRLKAEHPKPVVAVVNTMGASAAYMISIYADKIVCGRYSQVGSIGVIMSAYNVHRIAERLQVDKYTFTSGPLKSFMDPLDAPSPAVKEKAQEMVNQAAGLFIEEVKQRRGAKLKPGVDVFTGEVWLGPQALGLGLVDELGTIESVASKSKLTPAAIPVGAGGMYAGGGSFADTVTEAVVSRIEARLLTPRLQ